jgi:type I restriction enzyme S subunit
MSWPKVALSEICIVDWGNTSLTKSSYVAGGDYLAVSATGGDGRIDHWEHKAMTPVISAIGAQCGKLFLPKEDFTAIKNTITLTPIDDSRNQEACCPIYLYYLLSSMQLPRRGAGQPFISKGDLEKFKIPLPPLEEQRRIAAILDKAGNLRQHANGQLCQAKDLLASLFIETIGDPHQNPRDWSTLPLAEAVQAGTDVTYGIVQAGEEFPGGIPYIRTGDIVDGEIDLSALRHTDPAIASRFMRSTVRTGEIIMSIRATVGTTAIIPPCLDGANLTQGTARVAPGKYVNGVYLLQYLRMPSTQVWIQRQVKGATFREITLARLRELPVLIPPMAIQDKFADKAMLANSAIDSSKVLLSRIENLSLSLGNQLLGRK